MKFLVSRASDLSCRKPPCNKAKCEIENNYWGEAKYSVEINSLDDLLSFIRTENNRTQDGIVICKTIKNHEISEWQIIIYDDYLE